MNPHPTQQSRVLAIAPSTRGFGFAVFEGRELVDWGVKSVQGDKNRQCLLKVKALIVHYRPDVMVLEGSGTVRRAARIRALNRNLLALAPKLGVRVAVLSREQVRQVFFGEATGTKHELAELLACRFPVELGPRLPPKRKPWKSEDARMDIFAAVALATAFRARNNNRAINGTHFADSGDRLLD